MNRHNPPAEKAKEVARAAHAEEIARWRERLAQEEQEHSIALRGLADAKARAGRHAILVFILATALILSIPAHVTIRRAMQDPPQAWREDTYSLPLSHASYFQKHSPCIHSIYYHCTIDSLCTHVLH